VEVFLLVAQGFILKGNTEIENWDFRNKKVILKYNAS